jgi:hypothetical protein
MLHWEMKQTINLDDPDFDRKMSDLLRVCDAMTDQVLQMWEAAGLTAKADLQERVVKFRNATQ